MKIPTVTLNQYVKAKEKWNLDIINSSLNVVQGVFYLS